MRILILILLSFTLISCDGFDINAVDDNASEDRKFTKSELAFTVLFSSLLLNDSGFSNNKDGFIVLFNSSSNLDQIELRSNNDNSALVGSYPWEIVDNKLQVAYPNGATCSSSKTSESNSEYKASSNCEGGEPNNDRIQNTLKIPFEFDSDDLSQRTVDIENGNKDKRIEFFVNNNFEISDLNSDGVIVPGSTQVGTYNDSTLSNIVEVDNMDTTTDEYSRFVLLEGSLSSGTMLELRYKESAPEALIEVLIYDINANNQWEAISVYDDITIDQTVVLINLYL